MKVVNTMKLNNSNSQQDTSITHSAKDSTIFDIAEKKMYLYGSAVFTRGKQVLTAEFITIDFGNSELFAEAKLDSSTNEYIGVPVFKDESNEFSSIKLSYNFKTKKGTLASAETKFGDGFYYGDKIKKVSDDTYFVKNATYTTCDAKHPHYYFYAPKMKVIANDKVFANNLVLFVADVPIFALPFGVYFPKTGGKQSGILIPTPLLGGSSKGVGLEKLGFFWAGNDYFDDLVTANIYSIGGYNITNYLRFRNKNWKLDRSDLTLTTGRSRYSLDESFVNNFIGNYQHEQRFGRYTRIGGNLQYSTSGASRNTASGTNRLEDVNSITQQEILSDFSFSTSGKNWALSASYSNRLNDFNSTIDESFPKLNLNLYNQIFLNLNQSSFINYKTNEITKRLPYLSISLPTWRPFENSSNDNGFLSNLSMSISTGYINEYIRSGFDSIKKSFNIDDSRKAVTINPSISFTPKIGYFTIEPSFRYSSSIFFRKTKKEFFISDSTIRTSQYDSAFHYTQSYSGSITISTKRYGIIQPRIFGINAIRHTYIPRITISYQPDFPQYFDSLYNPISNRFDLYSKFETDNYLGNSISKGQSALITYSLNNILDAKISQGDTLDDYRRQLMSLNINGSYNPLSYDGLKWGDIFIDASTDLGIIGSLSGNTSLSFYEKDSLGKKIPSLLFDSGKFPFITERSSLTFSTSFGSNGLNDLSQKKISDSLKPTRSRTSYKDTHFDIDEFTGEIVNGNHDFSIPWRIGFTGSYSLSRYLNSTENIFSIFTDFSLTLTPTLRLSANGSYDFRQGEFLIPNINITKDLHCWEMQLNYIPTGFLSGIYFKIGLKAPSLKDIKYEYRGY